MPIRTFVTVIALAMSGLYAAAQTSSSTVNTSKKTSGNYNQVASVAFAGPACGISLQYDIRFNSGHTGLGARAAVAYVPPYEDSWKGTGDVPVYYRWYDGKPTVLLGLNYVLAPTPNSKNMVEFGAGATYLFGDSLWYDDITTSYAVLGWISANYRRTIGKRLLMRVGASIVGSKRYIANFPTPEWSLGYRF